MSPTPEAVDSKNRPKTYISLQFCINLPKQLMKVLYDRYSYNKFLHSFFYINSNTIRKSKLETDNSIKYHLQDNPEGTPYRTKEEKKNKRKMVSRSQNPTNHPSDVTAPPFTRKLARVKKTKNTKV